MHPPLEHICPIFRFQPLVFVVCLPLPLKKSSHKLDLRVAHGLAAEESCDQLMLLMDGSSHLRAFVRVGNHF